MKRYIYLLIPFLFLSRLEAQNGCTDPQASNYNSGALTNDGSCTYTRGVQPFTLKVNTLNVSENSGIEWVNGKLFTFGDDGNPPTLFRIDTTNGTISQSVHLSNYPNTDWEDITADTAFVYIGDFGNNDGNRTDLRILKIKKSDFINNPASIVTLTAQAINFSYADQTSFVINSNTNFDCEAMINVGDSLFIFTKDRGDAQTRVYRLPKTPGTYTISPYTSYNVNGKITGADYNPISKEVLLIGYLSGDENSFIWYLNDFQGVSFFSGNKRRVELGNTNYAWQTEGICFYNETNTHRIFISCETNGDGLSAGVFVSDVSQISDAIPEHRISEATLRYLPDNSIRVSCGSEIKTAAIFNLLGQTTDGNQIECVDGTTIHIRKSAETPVSIGLLKIETTGGAVYVNKILH